MNTTLHEKDLKPFVIDKFGNEIKVGDVVKGEGCWYFKVIDIVNGGEIDQEPLLKLQKITFRLPSEVWK